MGSLHPSKLTFLEVQDLKPQLNLRQDREQLQLHQVETSNPHSTKKNRWLKDLSIQFIRTRIQLPSQSRRGATLLIPFRNQGKSRTLHLHSNWKAREPKLKLLSLNHLLKRREKQLLIMVRPREVLLAESAQLLNQLTKEKPQGL